MLKKLLFCLLFLPTLVAAETAPNPAVPLTDTEILLGRLVNNAIIPLYRELQVTADTLEQRSRAFCSEPNAEKFKVLREGWGETLLAWHRTDALLFGPAVEEQVDFRINFNPPKKLIISRLLTDDLPMTPELVDKSGVGGQGLGTLEFLLFDRDKTETEQLAAFQGEAGKRRCAYVQAASQLLHQDISTIADGWLKDSKGYATAFRTPGNATFANAQQVIDLLVGKLYQSAEKTTKNRIGNPLGKGVDLNTGGKQEVINTSNAYQLEAWRSGYSIQVIRANVEGMQRILRDGGLLQWLREHNRSGAEKFVADAMEQRLDNYLKLPQPQTDPFTLVSTGQSKELEGYYFLGNDILNGVKLQLAKILGVNLGFNDNDGD